tara:strand:- start:429 stop:623 length:195 start_codon:yes stop_codon:yes gene_type:complete
MIKLLTNILRIFKETKPKVVDCEDLLTPEQHKQISDIVFEALGDNDIHPELWEIKVEAIIDSEH